MYSRVLEGSNSLMGGPLTFEPDPEIADKYIRIVDGSPHVAFDAEH